MNITITRSIVPYVPKCERLLSYVSKPVDIRSFKTPTTSTQTNPFHLPQSMRAPEERKIIEKR